MATPIRSGRRAAGRCGLRPTGCTLRGLPRDQDLHHFLGHQRDCDPWSEPEGAWHLGWKARFPADCCEVGLQDQTTGEWHRADVRAMHPPPAVRGVVLELQHSSISPEEQAAREAFYGREHLMYWLLHIHGEKSFRDINFKMALTFADPVDLRGNQFFRMQWYGPGKQFIDRWKQSPSHVFLDCEGHIFYLATMAACADLVGTQKKGQFALMRTTPAQLIAWVRGVAT